MKKIGEATTLIVADVFSYVSFPSVLYFSVAELRTIFFKEELFYKYK